MEKKRENSIFDLRLFLVKSQLIIKEYFLREKLNNLFEQLRFMLSIKNKENASQILEHLLLTDELLSITDDLRKLVQSITDEKKSVYLTSSLFLLDCYKYLNMQNSVESLHLVSGIELENLRILDRMVKVSLEKQNSALASADPGSLANSLIELEIFGHKLLAYFHIHPGNGKYSTLPSSIDLRLQKILEQGGYNSIGAIFSRDGYLRFFPQEKEFEVLVYGKGVEKEDDKVFKIVQSA